MEGVHSIDVGVLMLPIVVEMLKFVAESNKADLRNRYGRT